MSLASIRDLVKEDIAATDKFIISQLESRIPLVHEMVEYVLSCGGKRVRPMVLLLCARMMSEKVDKHIDLAAVIELIHTATLLHDDVVDDATLRRGHDTANIVWGNEHSVLVGDFLYSRAFQIVVDLKHHEILSIFAKATHYIAEGEIMQLLNCHKPETTEAFYYEIIDRKTARLFEIAAELGGQLTTENPDSLASLREFGQNFGLAYQLIDDALDYNQPAEQTGKNIGQDLADGKTTMPLIHAMSKSKGADLKLMQDAIKQGGSKELDNILGILEATDAIEYTASKAKQHAATAKEALGKLPGCEYRTALESMTDFVVERTY